MSEENAPVEADTASEAPESWRDALGEDIKENATLAKYDSVEKLASAHINLQRHLGSEKIAKPVTESDWDDVYSFLGRPEEAAGYEIALNEEWGEGVRNELSDQNLEGFRAEAHKLGLNAAQAQGLINYYGNTVNTGQAAIAEAQGQSLQDAEKALHAEWGQAFDQRLDFAKKAASEYGGDEFVALMEQTGLGNNPAVLKMLANVAQSNMSDKDLAGPTNGAKQALTPQEARDEATKFMSHEAYLDKRHPEHTKLVKQVQSMFEAAYNG